MIDTTQTQMRMGVLGMTEVFARTRGLPLIGVVYGVANAMQALFGDDDEPWAAETELRSFLADYGFGRAMVDRGLLNALTPWDVVLQASGFMPDVARAQWDTNRARKNYEQEILNRRRDLIGAYALAVMQDDQEAAQAAVRKIRVYNRGRPPFPFDRRAIRQSIRSRSRHRREAEAGIHLNKRLRGDLEGVRVPM